MNLTDLPVFARTVTGIVITATNTIVVPKLMPSHILEDILCTMKGALIASNLSATTN